MRKLKYVSENLTKGENILIAPELSGLVWFSVIIVFLLGCAIPLFLLVAIWMLLKWNMTEYAITNKKVICKTGIISVITNEIRLSKVESVSIERNFFEILFGCGTVVFNGTGNTKVKFEYVANPQKVKSEIDDALDNPTEYEKNIQEEVGKNLQESDRKVVEEKKSQGFNIAVGIFVVLAIIGVIGESLEKNKKLTPQDLHQYEVKRAIDLHMGQHSKDKRLVKENSQEDGVSSEIVFGNGNIEGLYFVYADMDNHGIINFPACKTQADWGKYWESIIGDSDVNYVPSLMKSKKCEELNNGYTTKYTLRVNKVGEDKNIKEVIREDDEGAKVYYTNTTAFGVRFHPNSGGEEGQRRLIQRLKQFEEEDRDKVVSSDVAVLLCNTPKDFDKLFSAMGNETETRKAKTKCTKIKSKTPVKIVDIDKKSLWVQYEVLSGPYKGKKLWGFPK